MPVTFATYAIGMMALSGVPLLFSGFWSKDEILHSAWSWPVSRAPFYLGLFGAFLTAFYMTRQMWYVFFGKPRSTEHESHESPSVMTIPLMILAACAVLLSLVGSSFPGSTPI
jgi:NADH-quinone oxidoreductase subunit L